MPPHKTRRPLSLLIVLGAIAAFTSPGARGQTQPTFRLAVEYIEVDARVEDDGGRPVRGLTRDDFRLFEDGVEQEVATLVEVNLPVRTPTAVTRSVPALRSVPVDVVSNTRPEERLFVILLDDRHVADVRSNRVRTLVKSFIEDTLGPNDLAAVLATSGRRDLSQDFTSDKTRLLRAVDGFVGRKLPSATMANLERPNPYRDFRRPGTTRTSGGQVSQLGDQFASERRLEARLAMSALRSAATWMAGIQGRHKALVFVTEGFDYDTEDVMNDPAADQILEAVADATAVATRANVTVYPVDPRGLDSAFDELMQIGGTSGPSAGLITELESEKQRAHIGLRTLAAETGGVATLNTNDFSAGFETIVEHSSSYYLLGYYPTNARREGRFRDIDVRVNRQDIRVNARRGYTEARETGAPAPALAGPDGTSPRVRDALNTPLPSAALSLSLAAVSLRGSGSTQVVAIIAEASGSDLGPPDATESPLELAVVAVDQNAKVVASGTSAMTLRDATLARAKANGFRFVSRLELKPGKYQIRVVAAEGSRSRAGSVWYDIEVPDFRDADLAMSGVLLGRAASLAVVADPTSFLATGRLPLAPTTERTFSRADEVIAFAEIYDHRLEPRHDVAFEIRIESRAGQRVMQHTAVRTHEDLRTLNGLIGVTLRFPLSDVEPGEYVLTIEARRRGDRPQTTFRQVGFSVD